MRIISIFSKFIQHAASQFRLTCSECNRNKRSMVSRIGVIAVVFVDNTKITINFYIFRTRLISISTGIHKYRTFFSKHCICFGCLNFMGFDLSAANRNKSILVCLKSNSGNVHIYIAVNCEFRVSMVSITRFSAITGINPAHIIMGDICP